MRVTVCQMDPRPGHVDDSMRLVREHVADHSPDLLLLSELVFSDWLPAHRSADPRRWADAVEDHLRWIATFDGLGVDVVLGTRPTVEVTGSRRNEAFVWTADIPQPTPVRQKYYLPEEPGFWEQSWLTAVRGSSTPPPPVMRGSGS
jgi:N-carbamoylputrescine amidase